MRKPSLIPTKFTDEDRVKARTLWLELGDFQKVAVATGVSVETLRKWATRGHNGITWQTEREERTRMILEDGFSKRKLTVSAAANLSTDLVLDALKTISARNIPLSTQELERVTNVATAFDRMARLDGGKSTENANIQAKVVLSVEEIKKILKDDPLTDLGD
jgi:hypothetical protein